MSLLEIKDLTIYYRLQGGWVHAIENVSVNLESGERLGLVGESGCGKTTLAYSITFLLPNNAYLKSGTIKFEGKDLTKIAIKKDGGINMFAEGLRDIRWKEISIIFQSAMNSFNPVMTIGDQIAEAIQTHESIGRQETEERIRGLYEIVGIPKDRMDSFPHEYSGGMRQRSLIAMSIALNPKLIIADEPTTALDVITQDRILAELVKLQKSSNSSMIIISHDISIVAQLSTKIAIMYAGEIVEMAPTREIFKAPRHPYTMALLKAFPSIRGEKRRLVTIPGSPPDLVNPPKGCRFSPRCPFAKDKCKNEEPQLREVSADHSSACHFFEEIFEVR
ncbi:MAG: ABC transporter ATP-binding protein [Candidatus Thermoplasmatota archaeon]|nr:ABC transporter ATP-binding protein [Candidatus Thermoplasmatota archaeon]MCL6003184.1 ABC transporter ATP-binding protein [Candidatus Thermoplasmatota archaeon]